MVQEAGDTELTHFQNSTNRLRHLTTLGIQRWPFTREPFSNYNKIKPSWLSLYEHQLQRLAQRIFEASDENASQNGWGLGTRSLLAVIAFGGNGKSLFDVSNNEMVKLKQIPFVRGLKVDPFGKSSLLAVKTEWRMVSYVEPESDILDHSLYNLEWIYGGP